MSSIDERIVAMKFDNAQFQKGVSDTTNSLDKLKNSLDMGGLAQSVENISSKFSVLGAVGFAGIMKLVDVATDVGMRVAAAVTDPLIQGGQKRALAIEQALFKFEGLGMDVEATMAAASRAVDGTAYSLDAAATAAANFGASGIQIDVMAEALRGISGVAALAGSSYEDIADVFSKVAGQGRLMGDDLNRLASRGVNAAATLAQAMGLTEAEVRAMVTKGQISFETFATAMNNAFGDHATKANETYAGSLSNIRSAIARISDEFFTINFEYQRRQFNAIRPVINEFSKSLVPLEDLFRDIQYASAETFEQIAAGIHIMDFNIDTGQWDAIPSFMIYLSNGLRALWEAWNSVVTPIKNAWAAVFPSNAADRIEGIRSALAKIAMGFSNFAHSLILSEEQMAVVQVVFTRIFQALSVGVQIVTGTLSVLGNIIGKIIQILAELVGFITPLFGLFPEMGGEVKNATVDISGFFDTINNAIDNIGPFITMLQNAKAAFKDFVEANKGNWAESIGNGFQWLISLGDKIVAGWKAVKGWLKSAWEFTEPLRKAISDIFSGIGEGIQSTDWGLVLTSALAAINVALVWKIIQAFKNAAGEIGSIAEVFTEGFNNIFGGLTGTLEAMQSKLKADALLRIAISIGVLAASLAILASINPENMATGIAGLAAVTGAMLGTMKGFEKFFSEFEAGKMAKISGALIVFGIAVIAMATALKIMSSLGWEGLAQGLIGLAASMGAMIVALLVMDKIDNASLVSISFAMILMANAVLVMAGAVAAFAMIDPARLADALVAMAISLGILTVATMVLAKAGPSIILAGLAMVAMSVSMLILAGVIAIFAAMSWETFLQGITMTAIALGVLTVAAIAMGLAGPMVILGAAAMVIMGAALYLIAGAIAIFGAMSLETVTQGLLVMAVTLGVLAVAMLAMLPALPGAAATLVASAALIVLSLAILALGAIPTDMVVQAMMNMVAMLLTFGAVSLVLTPVIPLMLLLAGALTLAAVGVLIMGAAMAVLSLALMLFGPAAMIAAGGLSILAMAVMQASQAIPAFLGLGAGLIAFGIGAAAAGIGVILLGTGLLMLGAGLAIVAASGPIGALALTMVIDAILKLLPHVIPLGIMAGTFIGLGAGLLVLGAGALVAGAGLLLLGAGLMLVMTAGTLASAAFTLIAMAMERLSPKVPSVIKAADALTKLGSSAATASVGLTAGSMGMAAIMVSVAAMAAAVQAATLLVVLNLGLIGPALLVTSTTFATLLVAMVTALKAFENSLQGSTRSAIQIISTLGPQMTVHLRMAAVGLWGEGYAVGSAITDGMASGLQNGSWKVRNAAVQVAASALRASKNELGIASPSKEFFQVGMWADEGLADGFSSGTPMVLKSVRSTAQASLDVMRKSLEGLGQLVSSEMDTSPTIRPVLDLSQVKSQVGVIGSMFGDQNLGSSYSYQVASDIAATRRETTSPEDPTSPESSGTNVTFIQNNTSPKALSESEIYRQTKNQLSVAKEVISK